jgi:hypothetical protein
VKSGSPELNITEVATRTSQVFWSSDGPHISRAARTSFEQGVIAERFR